MKPPRSLLLAGLWVLAGSLNPIYAQGTAFSYEGRLHAGGQPAHGSYDFRFEVFDAASPGATVAGALRTNAVPVSNGLFSVTLDFGSGVFTGPPRWLEVSVSTNGAPSLTTLAPRQPLLPTPYANRAASAGTVAASGITGTLAPAQLPAAVVTNAATGISLSGTFTGNGAGLTSLYAWQLGGNAGTTPGLHFLGTTDDQPLELRAHNQFIVRAAGGIRLYADPVSVAGVALAPFGTAWSVLSDRAAKKNFAPVDAQALLAKLAALPVQQWNYQWEPDEATPHLGPTAQDFKAAFYPGRDDKHITTLEVDGVALAAIQGLHQMVQEKDARIAALERRQASLEEPLAELERRLTALVAAK